MDDWGERVRPACGFGRRARTIVGQMSWLKGFRRDAENGNRDGRAPHFQIPHSLPRRSNSPRRNEVKTGAKTGALRIPHSAFRTGKALFRYSFWDGRLGGARASRVQVRASRPNHRWTNWFVDGFSARRRKRQPGRSRSPFKTLPRRSNSPRRNAVKTGAKTGALRIPHSAFRSLHSALERLFSCVQFAMDNWGNWGCIFTAYFQLDLKFLHPDSPNFMNNALKSQILEIVTGVPSGCIFDSHFVIAALWEQPSDECLRYCVSFLQAKRANSELAKQIGRCTVDGRCIVEQVGKAWSNTIRHKPGECTCWRRL